MKTYIFPWVLIWPDDPLPSCCFFDIVRQNSVGELNDWFKSKPVLKKGWAFLFFEVRFNEIPMPAIAPVEDLRATQQDLLETKENDDL
jgi:hypothetical protein